ncbi:MAG TPA: DUF1553 domain-containing protein [Rhodopirellula baltica]|uniref:Similar to S-layer related protein n=1 Tax=Rhodopirellula baltica (strain DSM 10527 / NCIMB 13988 / SH1) TaxID=243090 RepID=Q7UGF6_RHOBA|nr:DUF1553 domain-containing protein [Rhodopirellula baltica]CAD78373.1 similar to S-layer related protein [Rhodopirellula baltica SH 1]HBE63255.1 DUF1553 domain-containing protein [Rhodopirellula baltica]
MKSSFHLTVFCTLGMLAATLFTNSIANADSHESVVLLPEQLELSHAGDLQRLSVATWQDGIAGATIDEVAIESSDPSIVKVVGQTLHAVSGGTATVTATTTDGRTTAKEVTVGGTKTPHQWSFRNDVQSVLAKQGCNMGACHGALAGKGGFVLSLRGYDSDADFHSITRQARGRRIEMADPGRSLLLAKPTGALPHKGGLRLDTNSRDYEILAQWIANGAEAPSEDDALIEKITVTPENAKLHPGDHSQVLVTAHYDDGTSRDVTHWSQFTATDEAVAGVDESGRVQINGSGEAAVLVWYASKVALARMTVPYPNEFAAEVYASAPRRNFIDDLNLQQLQTLQLPPSEPCDDETFLRRATLDTIGRLPTQSEREQYFSAPEHQRRDALIDQLLAAESFTDYWSYKWSDLLVINGNKLRPVAVKSYYDWLHDSVRTNKPWDVLVREILTSTGSSATNGATNFFAVNQTPEDMTESACQSFLGLSIGCAKCHNHPLEKWTNDQYYAMANLFSRVRAKGWGGDSRNGDGVRQLYVSTSGELVQPNLGKAQPPAPLDSEPMAFDDPRDRREVLAEWLTDPANPYFARSITNRIWANFFGRGLVEQVDDLRLSNPASNEDLLNAASKHLSDSGFDLKTLMRTILQSETYQRSSLTVEGNREDPKYLSHYAPRRLMAEVLLDSMDQVLGTSTSFTEIAFAGADKQKTDFYKAGTRAIELYDSAVDSYFLKTFGRNPREIVCECERDAEPSMVQVLHLSNGETLNPKLNDPASLPSLAAAEKWDRDEYLDTLFQRALSRVPTAAERQSLGAVMDEYEDDQATAMRDVAWSVLTSVEFTYNH